MHKFNQRQPWNANSDNNGGVGSSSGIYGVIKHMTDDPHSLDEYSYGRIPEPPKRGTSTVKPFWQSEEDDLDDTYDPHKYVHSRDMLHLETYFCEEILKSLLFSGSSSLFLPAPTMTSLCTTASRMARTAGMEATARGRMTTRTITKAVTMWAKVMSRVGTVSATSRSTRTIPTSR